MSKCKSCGEELTPISGGKFDPDNPNIGLGTYDTCRKCANAEPTFTLRAQDRSAAALIRMWIVLNNDAPPEKLESARRVLDAFLAWPTKKKAD